MSATLGFTIMVILLFRNRDWAREEGDVEDEEEKQSQEQQLTVEF